MRPNDTGRADSMTPAAQQSPNVPALDDAHVALVRAAGAIAAAAESRVRECLLHALPLVSPEWMEEVILQSYLFAGFPRALNAAREWRRVSLRPAPSADPGEQFTEVEEWRRAGESTCRVVYGETYDRLRHNIRTLHPALDAWMIVEGYGKVLSRPALDLRRRELCIVAACAAAGQDRQLHAHLRGALNAGASPGQLDAVLVAIHDLIAPDHQERYHLLLARVATPDVH